MKQLTQQEISPQGIWNYQPSVLFLRTCLSLLLSVFLFFSLWELIALTSSKAEKGGKVQVLTGKVEPGQFIVYRLPNLKRGERLYVYLNGTSGDLDPALGLVDASQDINVLEKNYRSEIKNVITGKRDPLEALEEIRKKYFLIWDDDSGEGYAAAFEYEVKSDGDYRLVVGGSLSAVLNRGTFGGYRLLVGLNAPRVLKGDGESTGDKIAIVERGAIRAGVSVQEVTGALGADKTSTFVSLNDFDVGDTLYVFIEATSGDLIPTIMLRDYGRKPVRTGNLMGRDKTAILQYTFDEEGSDYNLLISAYWDAERVTKGSYRLLVGVNAPKVLTGKAAGAGQAIIRKPIEVKVGLKLQQIIQVDQQQEFFSIVGALRMDWTDPALAFSPDTCQCLFKTYNVNNFNQFVTDVKGRWPNFSLYNQQGNRWSQNRVVVVRPDGSATYFERFSTNLQVDFDFRKFPFDTQPFFIRVDMIYPEEFYTFSELGGFSEISKEHGEDEFIITGFDTSVSSEKIGTDSTNSRFTFRFEAPRHLDYYIFRILIPVFLIIIVSWVTFFLKDYTKRAEVAAANLLLFIAFSFSLAENYPRLGYLTLLDLIMAITFIVNGLVVIYNVYLRYLEINDKAEAAHRIDDYMDWFYPAAFVVATVVLFIVFFR